MWGITFGGGRKVKQQRPLSPDDNRPQSTSPVGQARGVDWAAKRRQWNFKLLQSPTSASNKTEKKTSENEEFLPPQLSLMEYFLRKVWTFIEIRNLEWIIIFYVNCISIL